MARTYVLVDAHSIIFRSYFAFIRNPLKNSRGETTSGIFGFLNTLDKIRKKFDTEYLALAFDTPAETFRDQVFKEYKATRPSAPPDIPFQIIKSKEIAGYLGLPMFEQDGFEADDVLATLAQRLSKLGMVYIVTSDKDLLQLVSENIFIYDAYGDITYNAKKVREKFGVEPKRIPDYLALVGDASDNVPGVPGIGPKRALEILNKYESLDQALLNDRRLVNHQDDARLSKKLILLEQQVPIEFTEQDLRSRKPDYDKLLPVLIDLDFHAYIRDLGLGSSSNEQIREIDPVQINFGSHAGLALDENRLFLVTGETEAYVLPLARASDLKWNEKTVKVGYDLKSALKQIKLGPPLFDISVAAWLVNPTHRSYPLDDIALQHLNRFVATSPASNARTAYDLFFVLTQRLRDLDELALYHRIEEPLLFVLARMEERGIGLDVPYLQKLGNQMEQTLTGIEKQIYELAGRQFNLNSPKQLAQVLFEELKLSPGKRRKTHYSTDMEILQQLSRCHPLPAALLRYRELKKITSTYIEPLIGLAHNGRIHTTFNQTGTSTGRLSSSNPNLQNIPIRRDLGRSIRRAFVARSGFTLISADYSQIELRILAHLSGDEILRQAFARGGDIHQHTASLVFGIPEAKVTEPQRRMAKVVNYGLIYGMSDFGLAQNLDIGREEAQSFIQQYYALYRGVDAWREKIIQQAETMGYSQTMFGRRRPIPEFQSDNNQIRDAARRVAINTPIQGTAADMIKLAMIQADQELMRAGFASGLILSVHDELLFEIESTRVEEAKKIIRPAMEQVVNFQVPIEVTIGIGDNWAEAH